METFEFNLDRKETIWYSVPISVIADSKEEAQKILQQRMKEIDGNYNILDVIDDDNISVIHEDGEYIYELCEPMTPEQNRGLATVEVTDTDDGQIIYNNIKNNNGN